MIFSFCHIVVSVLKMVTATDETSARSDQFRICPKIAVGDGLRDRKNKWHGSLIPLGYCW